MDYRNNKDNKKNIGVSLNHNKHILNTSGLAVIVMSYFQILKDGMVALESGVQFIDWTWREGMPNPSVDKPFIAPFHYEAFLPLIDAEAYHGKIY